MKCFIITPIGADGSEIRRKAEGVINSVIRPLLTTHFEFEVVEAAHEIEESGSINNQIIDRIIQYDLVIANLTTKNPNVMYEVAVRHATKKPIIHICEKGESLPFDIIEQRTLFYSDDMLGVKELENRLINHVKQLIETKESPDNPVFKAMNELNIYESLKESSAIDNDLKDILSNMLSKMDTLDSRITKVNKNGYNARTWEKLSISAVYDRDAAQKVLSLHPTVYDSWEEKTEYGVNTCFAVDKILSEEKIQEIVEDYL